MSPIRHVPSSILRFFHESLVRSENPKSYHFLCFRVGLFLMSIYIIQSQIKMTWRKNIFKVAPKILWRKIVFARLFSVVLAKSIFLPIQSSKICEKYIENNHNFKYQFFNNQFCFTNI